MNAVLHVVLFSFSAPTFNWAIHIVIEERDKLKLKKWGEEGKTVFETAYKSLESSRSSVSQEGLQYFTDFTATRISEASWREEKFGRCVNLQKISEATAI